MKRRSLLAGVSAFALLFKEPAEARFPTGGGASGGGNTIAPAFFTTTNVLGGDYTFLSVAWTGSAPGAIVSATWSGSGGSGSVLSGSFAVTGRTAQFAVSTPSPGSTTSYNLSVIADNGASTTFSGISVLKPVVDFAPGIYGPSTITYDQGQGQNVNFSGPIIYPVIGSYFVRGLPGPLTATLSDHVPMSGDAALYTLATKGSGYGPGITNAFNLCSTQASYSKSQYVVDLSISNGITSDVITITINYPVAPAILMLATNTLIGGAYFIQYYDSQLTLDSAVPSTGTTVQVCFLNASGGVITFTPDSGNLLSFTGSGTANGFVTIDQSSLTAANYGHITFQAQTTAGPLQTFDVYLGHCRAPTAAWIPNGKIYSSTPATTGFSDSKYFTTPAVGVLPRGSNCIGQIAAYSDEHGYIQCSGLFRYQVLSDTSGVLQVWNDGSVYLTGPVSAGTITASVSITTQSLITQVMTLSLPVLSGVTLPSTDITFTSAGTLTNFVPYANPIRNGSTSFPFGTPVSVGTFTVSGFSNAIDWTNVQTALVLGASFDNAQVYAGGDQSSNGNQQGFNVPRYIVTGSGTSGIITATNLSAINPTTPQTDTLRIQLTDGLGTFCTKDIPLTINWHSGPSITVGPGGTFASPNLMMAAMWADFEANGAASTYAGAIVTVLSDCPVVATIVGGVVGTTMTITSLTGGTQIAVGMGLSDAGSNMNYVDTQIASLGTGTGGVGTYTLNAPRSVPPGTTIWAVDWSYAVGGGGSHFSGGWLPYPVWFQNDTSTRWTGNGTISGTTLTVNSTASGAVQAGDYFTSGVSSAAVMVMSGSGTTWTVHVGPDPVSATLSAGPATMTTATPRFFMDAQRFPMAGSAQGVVIKAGYDLGVVGFEITNTTAAWGTQPGPGTNFTYSDVNASAIYLVANTTGNAWIDKCYIRNCDVAILNGGPGNQVTVTNSILAHCGNAQGSQHNIYVDIIAKFTFTNNQSIDALVGHEIKMRASQSLIDNNIFAEGPNGQGSCPINYTIGGESVFTNNTIVKTCNDVPSRNSLFHQVYNEIDGAQGAEGFALAWTWPYQNNTIDSCLYYNLVPRVAPFQSIQLFQSTGTALNELVSAPGYFGDPIRNTPLNVTVTNTKMGNILYTGAEYVNIQFGGVAPTLGSGNTSVTPFPASAIRLVDPITGTPPFRLPFQGPFGYFFGGHQTSSIGSSPNIYYMSLTVPSGSPSGTDVTGGLLSGYDGNWNLLGSPTYSFNNDYTTDNASFTFSTTANGIKLTTAAGLSDGLYTVTLQCVGTGWDSTHLTNTTITSISSFRVIVGGYV